MYTAFYGLREKPFALVPDPRYLFLSEAHREALAHLLYGIDQGEGFIAITGEVGTGKTTICRTLLERLGSETEVAFLFNPSLSGIELLQDISGEFGLDAAGKNRSELGAQLNRFLLAKKEDRRRVLLIIDEAQNLSEDTLEQVRLLSNLETASSKLIQILLLGQPELDTKLDSPALRQLRQRISVRWGLSPLSARETREYVRHRLYVAAGTSRTIFSDRALRQIHRLTGGVPRLVNVLSDRALLAGYVAKAPTIGPRIVRDAAREIPDAARRGRLRGLWWLPAGAVAAGVVAAVLVGGVSGPFDVSLGTPPETPLASESASRPGIESSPVGAPVRAPADRAGRDSLRVEEAVAVASAPPGGTEPPATGLRATDRSEPLASTAEPKRGDVLTNSARNEPAEAIHASIVAPKSSGAESRASGELMDGQFLGLALSQEDASFARLDAANAILRAFRLPAFESPPASDSAAIEELEQRGLAILPIRSADLSTLRALNHPALLRLGVGETESRLVALRQLEAERAWLYGPMRDDPLRVPLVELLAQWRGEAWVVWNEFEDARPVLAFGHHGSEVSWLQSALAELGYYDGSVSGLFDGLTRESVRALQVERRIPADGIAGPRTRMVLYDLLERYDGPRLVARPRANSLDHETGIEVERGVGGVVGGGEETAEGAATPGGQRG